MAKVYDNETLESANEYLNKGGCIWDAKINDKGVILTAADDGFLRAFNIDERKKIVFTNSTRQFESKALGVAWDNNQIEFYASYSDGIVRKFNNFMNVGLTLNINEGTEKNFAWALQALEGGILAVGCQDGSIKMFETKFGTILTSFHKHEASILAFH